MHNINEVVSVNLKRIRERDRLSLDAVAKMTGVSKSMLGQIERGEVNPTLATMWKITNGLRVSFSELISRPEHDFELLEQAHLEPIIEDNGRYRNYPLFTYDLSRGFEMYYIEMDPQSYLESEPHIAGTQEFITVFSGRLEIISGSHEMILENGSSARFKADIPHSYRSTADETCRCSAVISYSR